MQLLTEILKKNLKNQTVKFNKEENPTNLIAIDEKNGAWKSEYETSEEPQAIKVGKGTGSTPTLMGLKLLVITDGAERMNIVAFWRDEIPAGSVRINYSK